MSKENPSSILNLNSVCVNVCVCLCVLSYVCAMFLESRREGYLE